MIISASRRTDIPAFYADWFMNRIRAGFALVRNPFNANRFQRVSLAVKDVDALVFWTRNPGKLIPHLQELDCLGYRYYFQYTITGYPKVIEKSGPDLNQAISMFIKLSDLLGPQRVLWRYDPILVSNITTIEQHLKQFAAIASALRGRTQLVTISFAEFYKKTLKNLRHVNALSVTDITGDPERMRELVSNLARIAEHNDMEMRTCAVEADLRGSVILPGKCIDELRLKEIFGTAYPNKKDNGQRSGCNCVKSIDIGQYTTCLHGCLYCYATTSHRQAAANRARHDPASSVLIGPEPATDNNISCKPKQMSLF